MRGYFLRMAADDEDVDTYPDLDTALTVMSDAHLHCRDFGHSWRSHSARYLPDQRVYERTLRCSRCRTLRNQWISERGDYLRTGYKYAAHYQMRGVGRLTVDHRAQLRLASVQRDVVTPVKGRRSA